MGVEVLLGVKDGEPPEDASAGGFQVVHPGLVSATLLWCHSLWDCEKYLRPKENPLVECQGSADQFLLCEIFTAWGDPLTCGSVPWACPQCPRAVLHKHKHPLVRPADCSDFYVIIPATRQGESPSSFCFGGFGGFSPKCAFSCL